MARKNNDLESLGFAILLLVAMCTGIFFLFKWLIAGIIAIISVIAVWAINLKKKKEKEIIFKKWQKSLFGDSYIRPTEKVDIEELKEKLEFIDTTVYDDLFDSAVIERGKYYVWKKKITQVKIKNNIWSSIVQGKDPYNVKVYMEDDKVKKAECNCPYFHDKNKYCKHIYATLYFARSAHNIQKVLDSIVTFEAQLADLINMEIDYIEKHEDTLELEDIEKYIKNINSFKGTLSIAKKNLNQNSQYEDVMVSTLVHLMQDSYKLIQDVDAMIIEADKLDYTFTKKTDSTHYPENSDSNAAIAAGLFALNELSKKKKSQEQDDKLEKEMDIYGLEDWQKEEVRNGNYDPWSFEEEDLEEDDYFHDDSD